MPRKGEKICPHCGLNADAYVPAKHHLPPHTILDGTYLTGCVLGEGGFGITYAGWDLHLHIAVAIKEFFPVGIVFRDNAESNVVSVFSGSSRDTFLHDLDNFLREARMLGRFSGDPGVADVKNYFRENGTAYIVMEYVQGINLAGLMEQNGGSLPFPEVMQLLELPILTLGKMHRQGAFHRDISPENLMVKKDGVVKLIDFGSTVTDNTDKTRHLSVRPGYSPIELYGAAEEEGACSDIYSLSATIYKAVTGIEPPAAVERLGEDKLIPPIRAGAEGISPAQEKALMKGLAVKAGDRYQRIEDLYEGLVNGAVTVPKKHSGRSLRIAGICTAAVVLAAGCFTIWGHRGGKDPAAVPAAADDSVQATVSGASGSGAGETGMHAAEPPFEEAELILSKTEILTGESLTLTCGSPGAACVELHIDYYTPEGYFIDTSSMTWWGESHTEEEWSFSVAGTYRLSAKAVYYEYDAEKGAWITEDDDGNPAAPTEVRISPEAELKVNATDRVEILLPEDLPGWISAGEEWSFTVPKPEHAVSYLVSVWEEGKEAEEREWSADRESEDDALVCTIPEGVLQENRILHIKIRAWGEVGYNYTEQFLTLPVLGRTDGSITVEAEDSDDSKEFLINQDILIRAHADEETAEQLQLFDGRSFLKETEPEPDGNYSCFVSFGEPGIYTLFARAKIRGQWVTGDPITVRIIRLGDVGEFVVENVEPAEVVRGGSVTVTISEAENAVHYGLSLYDGEHQWITGMNFREFDPEKLAGTFSTSGLEPGNYYVGVSASAPGYSYRDSTGTIPFTVLEEPE